MNKNRFSSPSTPSLTPLSTDTIGSSPVFYNEKTHKFSTNFFDVIELSSIEFDHEGLSNYLNFGYSVFYKTPIKHIKFLPPNSTISHKNNALLITHHKDPIELSYNQSSTSEEVLDKLKKAITNWESKNNDAFLLPTSGGFDSRLLKGLISDKSRIRSVTYGISKNQKDSHEVKFAKYLSKIYKTDWTYYPLKDINRYLYDWFMLFGLSSHAHGMYQMNFYHQLSQQYTIGTRLLSGLFFGPMAGQRDETLEASFLKIKSPEDLMLITQTNPTIINRSCLNSNIKTNESCHHFYEMYKDKFKDPYWHPVIFDRLKSMLLSYGLKVPQYYGFSPYAPILDTDILTTMLNLNKKERLNRQWMIDFFKKEDIMVEDRLSYLGIKFYHTKNVQDQQSMIDSPLHPLDITLLSEFIKPEIVNHINDTILKFQSKKLHKFKISNKTYKLMSSIYQSYQKLYPIQKMIELRNYSRNTY